MTGKEPTAKEEMANIRKRLITVNRTILIQNKILANILDRLKYLEGKTTPDAMKELLVEVFEENKKHEKKE
jgi:hypothetical protein